MTCQRALFLEVACIVFQKTNRSHSHKTVDTELDRVEDTQRWKQCDLIGIIE